MKMGARFGSATGNFGVVLLGDGKGHFEPIPSTKSGLLLRGEVRNVIQDGKKLIFSVNDNTPVVYTLDH